MRLGFAEGALGMDAFGGWTGQQQTSRQGGRQGRTVASTGHDQQLGAIFRQMRAVVGMNEVGVARLLGTDLSVVMDLEAGIGEGLPAWPELVRIVERYGAIAGVDPSPLITRLMQISVPPATSRPAMMPRPPSVVAIAPVPALAERFAPPPLVPAARLHPVAPPSSRDADRRLRSSPQVQQPTVLAKYAGDRRAQPAAVDAEVVEAAVGHIVPRARRRWVAKAAGPLAVVVLLVGLYPAVMQLPRVAYASIGYFPARLQGSVRNVIDLAVLQTAAVRDGLRWVDVGDPRVRKTDRLKTR